MSPGRSERARRSATAGASTSAAETWTLPFSGSSGRGVSVVFSTFGSGKTGSLAMIERVLADATVSGGKRGFDVGSLNSLVGVKRQERKSWADRVSLAMRGVGARTLPVSQPEAAIDEHISDDADDQAKLLVRVWNSYREAQKAAAAGGLRTAGGASQFRLGAATKWEGVVLEVLEDSFLARLTDESGRQPEVEAEIFITEVSPADRELLRKRAVFYWVMGYRDTTDGERVRESRLRFRRLPGWRPEDLAEAEAWAERVRAEFGWG